MLRKSFLHIVFLISLMTLLVSGQATPVSAGVNRWTSIGPEGGWIRALAIDPLTPSILYAGTASGVVFKSTDGGQSWSGGEIGLPNDYGPFYLLSDDDITCLAIDPATSTTVYAGTNSGVYKTTNGGATWDG